MTQAMQADPSGVLAPIRAEQVFGMLQLADLLNLDSDICQFLTHHHAALLGRRREGFSPKKSG